MTEATNNNDVLTGTKDDDEIHALDGNDFVTGLGGSDEVWGGLGSDTIKGGAGADDLHGDDVNDVMFQTDLITMAEDQEITVTFDYEGAGYRNSLGVYKVDADTGEIHDIQLMWQNASLQGSGGNLIGGESQFTYETEAGDQVGFFLNANGYSSNNFANMKDGSFEFRTADGKPATINDTGIQLWHVSEDGSETKLNNPIYHTAAYGENQSLNPDGLAHTVGLLQSDDGKMQIGFEDLYNGGDKDFDDAVFTVDIGEASAKILNAHYDTELKEGSEELYVSSMSNMNVGETNDRIEGGQDADTIDGMQGNDLLAGGGAGNEWKLVNGEWQYDASAQVESNGSTPLDQSDDVIMGDTGDDVLLGGAGNDTMDGGAGDDRLNAGEGSDVADGGEGDDVINLEAGDDIGRGGAGNDTINAGKGNDVVSGGDGDDKLRGGEGNDVLSGDAGDDEIFGGAGQDVVSGGAGKDRLFGGEGNDVVTGGAGDDYVEGGAGADNLSGNAGADRLMGGAGDDALSGGDGNDKLVGGSGDDVISGGAGDDHLWGGNWSADGDADTFVFQSGSGKDMVHDFEVDHDQIDLSSYGLTYDDITARVCDKGWATEIELSSIDGGASGDKLLLVNVKAEDLSEDNFIV